MVTNDASILAYKHKVMEEVARLAWAGQLDEEHKEQLIYKLVPGPKATYRCCIYREREILRDRIRICETKTVNGNSDKLVVQVIESACQECPLATYSVTDNCRKCAGKACLNSCKFGAIRVGTTRMHIEADKCRECGQCAQACPYGAIVHLQRPCKSACPAGAISYDENAVCRIDDEKCIECGRCIHSCPFAAINSRVYMTEIIKHILAGDKVFAMCAPATEGQYGEDIGMASMKAAAKKLGFTDMIEVSLGADMTAAYEAAEWNEAYEEGRKMTTSCCPAFVNMMRKHFPKLYEENMSGTVSPMVAVSRYLKATNPGCYTVFIGPCIAKKSEARDKSIPGTADYALTFGEFTTLLRSRDITLEPVPEDYQEGSAFGKAFAASGGVAAAVLEVMHERDQDTDGIQLMRCSGGDECKKALTLLKVGRLPADFIEGMMCPGGCVGGPSRHKTETEIKKARDLLLKRADNRSVLGNLENYPMESFSMMRGGSPTGKPAGREEE